jgi:UDP-N-acetylglucosamine:LPS N-acetylglucosamine transferase
MSGQRAVIQTTSRIPFLPNLSRKNFFKNHLTQVKENKVPKICFVSSSGGHWEQLQKLDVLMNKYHGFLVTEKSGFDNKAKYNLFQTDLKDRRMIPKMLINTIKTVWIWLRERPDYVITTGTMVAYPFYLLSILTHKKLIFIETFGRANMPTVAGLKMQKRAALFIVQWESQKKYYKKAIYGGCLYCVNFLKF